jgi:hypothetical protein
MSKKTARSWKWMILTTTALVAGVVLVLNVGASAHLGSPASPAQPSGSTSPKASASPSPSKSPFPPPPPSCVPMVDCDTASPSAKPSTSAKPSPSTSPTPGGGTTEKSKISIKYNGKNESFKGAVDSVGKCEKGRRVDLFEVSPGKDTNLGHTVTLKKGKYTIPFPDANGRYYTKVKKSTPSRNLTCKGAQSKTISV